MRKFLSIYISLVLLIQPLFATTRASDGSQSDVIAKIALSSTGDTVTVPSGTFTWGASASTIIVDKAIHLTGLSGAHINLSTTGPVFGNGVITLSNGAIIDGIWTITGALNSGQAVTPISISGLNIVVTGIAYTPPATAGGYFVYVSEATGVSYGNTIHDASGTLQTYMIRGDNGRWSAANTMGTANAFYIEDNIIDSAYAQENDGAAASVVRFNTFTYSTLDMHMIETSTSTTGTSHGSRQMEAYNNTWTSTGFPQWVRAQGGTGMIFNNVVPALGTGGGTHYFALVFEYGAQTGIYTPGLATIPTPAGYPIPDQVGIGPYNPTQVGGAEPLYYFNNTEVGGADNPLLGFNPQSAAAIAAYGSTFYATSEDGSPYMYQRKREYFRGVAGGAFPSVSDVGYGTKATMLASSPTTVGQGWWVTDEGSWNTLIAANTSGQLYRWSGSAWVLFYTPYTYPHPLRAGVAPVVSSASIPSAGTSMSVIYSASCTTGAGGNGGVSITASGGAVTPTYSTGSGSTTYVYTLSRTINIGETVTTSYTQPGNGIEATSDQTDVVTYSGQPVTNNSTHSASTPVTVSTGQKLRSAGF